MRVAIIGDGLLGRSVADALRAQGIDHVLLGHADIEITSARSIDAALSAHEPTVAVNTVAFHRLMECESHPMLARLINTDGARLLAERVPTLYSSSDYVFNDGGPHDEVLPGDNPRSVYGQTKLAGELATLEHGGIVARVSALYGKHPSHKGPSFPEAMLASYAPVSLPNDQRFSPTWAPDAAHRIADLALAVAEGVEVEGIYHCTNAGTTTWAEFGQHVVELAGTRRKVTGHAAHDLLRPKNSALRNTRLSPLRHWLLALEDWAVWNAEQIRANAVSPLRAR